ncbi:MAG: acyl-CoA thioesterase [Rhodospirillales bacterium]|jgi:acyl-CoA thioesterase YciA|nr:acyl-CoA thioesterase [Rhodospirillales bacterium]MDP6773998.1 acyl-CoA thioesterase [Rhodospirillales bacterium]
MAQTSAEPNSRLTTQTVAMPADTNPSGDIFGGWLLSQMDIAGGVVASQRARGRTATVALEAMVFHRPVHVGDVVGCHAEILEVGATSVTVMVEAWVVRRQDPTSRFKVTEGQFTYVALDAEGKKRPLPPE